MRGLLTFFRGQHTLSNRPVRRKAGIVGSRCGLCGTQSVNKVRFELLLPPRPRRTVRSWQGPTSFFLKLFLYCLTRFVAVFCRAKWCFYGVSSNFVSAVDAALPSGDEPSADVADRVPSWRKTVVCVLCSHFLSLSLPQMKEKHKETTTRTYLGSCKMNLTCELPHIALIPSFSGSFCLAHLKSLYQQ